MLKRSFLKNQQFSHWIGHVWSAVFALHPTNTYFTLILASLNVLPAFTMAKLYKYIEFLSK